MSNYVGYRGKSLAFLRKYKIGVGDSVKISADSNYTGILMPRYEYSDDEHIVLKLESGYNIGLGVENIKKIEKIGSENVREEEIPNIQVDPNLPKILLVSTGGTIASKIDYRTGGVTPTLTAAELNAAVPELARIANIETEVLFSEPSENLLP
ncbi:MAG: asparaginase domain-containing protein, partial [Nitrosopumilaceae archaeon]